MQFNYIYWKGKDTDEEIKVEALEKVLASCLPIKRIFFKNILKWKVYNLRGKK